MKLHYEGVLPVGYWGDKYPTQYFPNWIAFTCQFKEKRELLVLEEYLCKFKLPYRLHNLAWPFWCLSLPRKAAMEFRLRFPCPSSCTDANKDFIEYEITL